MILALKLFLTPFFIAAVSLAGRRWGPGVSGLLIGLPLTSGPVSFILARQYGPEFALRAAVGSLLGLASVCVFCLVYSHASRRLNWILSSALSIAAFLLSTLAWNRTHLSLLAAFGALVLAIWLTLRLMPSYPPAPAVSHPPAWDLPARMLTASAFVFLLTTFAQYLGPQLSGLVAPFPIFANVLAVFGQIQEGPHTAGRLLRGVVGGSLAFASFFLVAGSLLQQASLGWTYAPATVAALGVNFLLLRLSPLSGQDHGRFPQADRDPGSHV